MDWFGWQLPKNRAGKIARFGPQALLQDMGKRVPRYLDEVDQGRLICPACKRTRSDADGDIGSIWDHTRLEAMRYVMALPKRDFELLGEPARQPEMLEAYLRQRPHDDTVIEFQGAAMGDLAIAIVAGFNWLNHCATLVEVNRERFSGTLRSFRKIVVLAQKWWAMEGADARCGQMLDESQIPPLMLYLVWQEYTRLGKEIACAALFGPSLDRAIEKRRKTLNQEYAGRPSELTIALDELKDTMASFEAARDPGDLTG
jgi:hypothetical protein